MDCRARNASFASTGIPACISAQLSNWQAEEFVVSARDYPFMGQLPGTCLCMEDDSRYRRCAQHVIAISARDLASVAVFAVQPICRRAHPDAYLYAVHVPADLCSHGAHPAQSDRSVARSWCFPMADLPARGSAS